MRFRIVEDESAFRKAELCEDLLIEDKVVKFDNQTYPQFGWCVILCGGPGIGKSTAFETLVPISARKYDVDVLKNYKIKTSDLDGDELIMNDGTVIDLSNIEGPYNLSNPDFTNLIHQATRPLSKKFKNNMYDMGKNAPKDRLPNIVFDITGSDITDFQSIITEVKPLGYKVAIVWVLGEIEQALDQNSKRPRQVRVDLLLSKHNDVIHTATKILGDAEMMKSINEFWIIMQVVYNTSDKDDVQRYLRLPNVYPIKTKEDLINLPDIIQDMIIKQRDLIAQKIADYEQNNSTVKKA